MERMCRSDRPGRRRPRPLARVSRRRMRSRRPPAGTVAKNCAIAARPRISTCSGGMRRIASSRRRSARAGMSHWCQAVMKRCTTSRSRSGSEPVGVSCGVVERIVARARRSALLTAATVILSRSATSAPCQPSTSRRMSTARWEAGRHCRTATKASATDSRRSAIAAGSASVAGTWSSRSSGWGVRCDTSAKPAGRRVARRAGSPNTSWPGAAISTGSGTTISHL
jgi:hypothetical protein